MSIFLCDGKECEYADKCMYCLETTSLEQMESGSKRTFTTLQNEKYGIFKPDNCKDILRKAIKK